MQIDVDHVMLPIPFDVNAEIDEHTPELMHTEHLFHSFLYPLNHALITRYEEIIHNPSDCGDNSASILKHGQSSVKT